MTQNDLVKYKIKGHICSTSSLESQMSVLFTLWLLAFQTIEGFGVPVWYNDQLDIRKLLKVKIWKKSSTNVYGGHNLQPAKSLQTEAECRNSSVGKCLNFQKKIASAQSDPQKDMEQFKVTSTLKRMFY